MFLFQRFCLCLFLLRNGASAFTTKAGVGPSGEALAIKPVQDHSTSLHVGVSYGPPSMIDERTTSVLLRRNNRLDTSSFTYLEVDPAFRALSIAYDVKDDTSELQRRKLTRAVAASTAVVCAALMAKGMVSSGAINFLLSNLPHFYKAYPLQASVATCGLNSALADTIAQAQSWQGKFQWKQLLSSCCYGSLCLGVGSGLVYTKLLPAMLAGTSGITTVVGSACLDNFLFAPLLWLPPAYAIKALFQGQSVKGALAQYVHAVRNEKLLNRYVSFWMPAQLLNFAIVPRHLRVATTAGFSFVWFMILSSITSKNKST